MKKVLFLILLTGLLVGCAGTTTKTGSENKEEKEYNISMTNCHSVELNLYLERSSALDSTSKSEGGEITTKPTTDLALEQTDTVENPGNVIVPPTNPPEVEEPTEPTEPPTEPTEPTEPEVSDQFDKYNKGTTGPFDGNSVIKFCTGKMKYYDSCELNGIGMTEWKRDSTGDNNRQLFYLEDGLYEKATIICEKKSGGSDKFVVTLGETGACR